MDGLTAMSEMSERLSFIFGIHAHRPVGDPAVSLRREADECYLPILDAALRHPGFKISVHFSAAVLRPLEESHPKLFEALQTLVARRQAEIIGGAMYDPILSALPDADRTGHIRRFNEYIQRSTGAAPKGMWLAERVWEPHLARPIRDAGLSYVVVEDNHLASTGIPRPDIYGTYLTEDAGFDITLFPVCDDLRRLIPNRSIEDILAYLKSRLGAMDPRTALLTFIDSAKNLRAWLDPGADGERGSSGIDRWMSAVESSDFLRTVTPSEWMAGARPRGLVYVPASSYAEMSQWTLPAAMQNEFDQLAADLDRRSFGLSPGTRRIFLRAGFWREFLTKYPESNWMHKRVTMASMKMGPVLDKLGTDRESRAIHDLLDRAACNDAYWHGTADGIYSPALRRAVFRNLIEAETRFAKKMGLHPQCITTDLDLDGAAELLLYTGSWITGIRPGRGGSIAEWSFRPALYNFQNNITRRAEGYHLQSATGRDRRILVVGDGAERGAARAKPTPVYDRYPRVSGLAYALYPSATLENFRAQTLPEIVPADGEYEAKVVEKPETFEVRMKRAALDIIFEKRVVLSKQESKIAWTVTMEMENPGASSQDARARLGLGWELFYGDAAALAIHSDAKEVSVPDDSGVEVTGRKLVISDTDSGTVLSFESAEDIRIWLAPVWAQTRSAEGGDRTFEGLSMMFLCGDGAAGARQSISLQTDAALAATGTQRR